MSLALLSLVGYFACLWALRFLDPYKVTWREALWGYGVIALIFIACCFGIYTGILHPH